MLHLVKLLRRTITITARIVRAIFTSSASSKRDKVLPGSYNGAVAPTHIGTSPHDT